MNTLCKLSRFIRFLRGGQSEAHVQLTFGGGRYQSVFVIYTREELRKKYVSRAEAVLLELLVNMPPGRVPSASKKNRLRPSSAAANIQSHPSFTTGLFDNVSLRPATAAAAGRRPEPTNLAQRPATQAAGGRRPWRSMREDTVIEPKDIHKQPRRLTIGAVDGIAHNASKLNRPGVVLGNQGQILKSKVFYYVIFNLTGVCLHW